MRIGIQVNNEVIAVYLSSGARVEDNRENA